MTILDPRQKLPDDPGPDSRVNEYAPLMFGRKRAEYSPQTIRIVRANAGKVPAVTIATALCWSLTQSATLLSQARHRSALSAARKRTGAAGRMKPFPYCPEALIKIRNGACAAALGWDSSFYVRVCREHGIEHVEIVRAVPREMPAAPAIESQPETAPTKIVKRIKRTRSKTKRYTEQITVFITKDAAVDIYNYAARHQMNRSDAIRSLIDRGLADDFDIAREES